MYRELFSFPIKDNPFFVKVNSIPGRGFIPNYLVWGFCVWGWDFKRVKARCSVLGFKVERFRVLCHFKTQHRLPNFESFEHPTLNPQTWELEIKPRPGIPPLVHQLDSLLHLQPVVKF